MNVFAIVLSLIGAAGTIFGIVSVINGLSTRKQANAEIARAHDDKVRAEAAEDARVSTQLSLIRQSMSGLEKGQTYTAGRVDTIEKTVSEHTAAIATLVDSNKQAHHRIDDLKNDLRDCKQENTH